MRNNKLLIRLPNWVGDVIMTLPAIDLLHMAGIEPILIGKPWIQDLLSGLACEKYTLPKKWSEAHALLKQIPTKDMLLFPNSFSSALLAKLAGKITTGFSQDGRSLLLNHAISKPDITHESHLFFYLAQTFLHQNKLTADKTQYEAPSLNLTQSAYDGAQKYLLQHHIQSPFIVICPFAHGLTRDKRSKKWPQWQELLLQLKGIHCVICPGPQEVGQASQEFSQATILKDVKLNEYAAILSQAKLVIANDSGPMHIAAAVNTPTLALFGTTDPSRAAPKNAIILGNKGEWPNVDMVVKTISDNL